MRTVKFTQGNGVVENVTISNDSKKKFGSMGFMWVVSFDNGTSHFMDKKTIFKATGVDMGKRGGIYHKDNLKLFTGDNQKYSDYSAFTDDNNG